MGRTIARLVVYRRIVSVPGRIGVRQPEITRDEGEERPEENHLLISADKAGAEESPFSDHLLDGRIVDAGLSIYRPEVLFENLDKAYDDWSGEDA